MKKTLGLKIRELRHERGLSLRDLGTQLGHAESVPKEQQFAVSSAYLCDIENSRRFPSDYLLRRLAKTLGVNAEELNSHDERACLQMLGELVAMNAQYGFAFSRVLKRVIDERIPPEEVAAIFGMKIT